MVNMKLARREINAARRCRKANDFEGAMDHLESALAYLQDEIPHQTSKKQETVPAATCPHGIPENLMCRLCGD